MTDDVFCSADISQVPSYSLTTSCPLSLLIPPILVRRCTADDLAVKWFHFLQYVAARVGWGGRILDFQKGLFSLFMLFQGFFYTCKYSADIALESRLYTADASESVKCFPLRQCLWWYVCCYYDPGGSLHIMMHRRAWWWRKDENPITSPTLLPADNDSWVFFPQMTGGNNADSWSHCNTFWSTTPVWPWLWRPQSLLSGKGPESLNAISNAYVHLSLLVTGLFETQSGVLCS